MNVELEPGKYVVAVSGGVDSVALLDLLAKQRLHKLIVAHFDHGIRADSKQDRLHVQALSKKYGLPFVYDEGHLGPGASEEKARLARYNFLNKAKDTSGAKALVTAHHQDDLIETALINLLRGTGRKGLSSLASNQMIVRPLLHISKKDVIKYAKKNKLDWREDPTNQDPTYLRNYVRHKILPRFKPKDKRKLIDIINSTNPLNEQIEHHLVSELHLQPKINVIDRHYFIGLPHDVSVEVISHWLRKHKTRNLNKKLLEQIVVGAKTLKTGKQLDIDVDNVIEVSDDELALLSRERQ